MYMSLPEWFGKQLPTQQANKDRSIFQAPSRMYAHHRFALPKSRQIIKPLENSGLSVCGKVGVWGGQGAPGLPSPPLS